MAQVRVGLAQATSGQLPPVCICCGARATRVINHKFYYQPTWLVICRVFLGYLLNVLAGAYRNVVLNVPVCDRHSWRLSLPTYATYAVLAWLLVGILACVAGTAIGAGMESSAIGGIAALVFFLPLLPLLFGLIVLQLLTPRTEYFDHQMVGFTGVATQFAQALGQGHSGSPGMPYGAPQPQYGAPTPQYAAPNQFQPYGGAVGAGGPAPRKGGLSPIVLVLGVVGVVVVGFVLLSGIGVLAMAMLMRPRANPIAQTPAASAPSSAVPGSAAAPTFPGPGPIGPSRPGSVPSGAPGGPAFGPPSAGPGTVPPGAVPPGFAPGVPGPFGGPGGPGQPPFGPRMRGPGGPAAASALADVVIGAPDASGKPTQFPPNTSAVTQGTQLVRGATVWGLDAGVWRKAQVLEPGTASGAKIHWIGWSESWDQVLPLDLLRLINAPGVAATTPGGPTTPEKPAAGGEVRTWSDFTGKFKIEAKFVSFDKTMGMVMLKKTDGSTTSISIAKLSFPDQQYVFARISKGP